MFENFFYTIYLLICQSIFQHQHSYSFQSAASINFERIVDLHHFLMFFLLIILMLIIWLLIVLIEYFSYSYNINTNKVVVVEKDLVRINYTKKFIIDFKLNATSFITLLEWDQGYLENIPIVIEKYYLSKIKSRIALNDHLNLYVKSFLTYSIVLKFLETKNFTENKTLEFGWTATPCFVLASASIPSFFVLYINEEILNPGLTVNIMSHQWYWSYDYTDLYPYWFNKSNPNLVNIDDFVIDSYMEPEEYLNLKQGALRLLETEEQIILPIKLHIRLVISSFDVLHSFAIPSMGIKTDAIPGRMNQIDLFIKRSGIFFGQCSEICGIGHGFMPIELHSISILNFLIGPFWKF